MNNTTKFKCLAKLCENIMQMTV